MDADVKKTLEILATLVSGGFLTEFFRMKWDINKSAQKNKQEFKEQRYKYLILLMYSALNFEKHKNMLQKSGRAHVTIEELLDEIKAEWNNSFLFASDKVLKSVHGFIKYPTN